MSRTPENVVRDFCAAWSRRDVDEIMAYFVDDATYHNMPGPPVGGRDAIRATIARFLGGWAWTEWEIRYIAAAGPTVLTERVDHIRSADGRTLDLPVAGVFEVDGERIRAWRDYFDLATYQRALG